MSLRPLLRIARRDAVRAKGRSALIMAMIALPIVGMTYIDVNVRTSQLSHQEQATKELGRADVRLSVEFTGGTVEQTPDGNGVSGSCSSETGCSASAQVDPETVLPPGSRTVISNEVKVVVKTEGGRAPASFVELRYDDPLVSPQYRQDEGRAPRNANEVAVTPKLLERTGLRIGDRLKLTKPVAGKFTIVGVVTDRRSFDSEAAYAWPGALVGRSIPAADATMFVYADTPGPFTWDQVMAVNSHGVIAVSRAVLLDPPPRDAIPFYQHNHEGSGTSNFLVVLVIVLVVGLAGLEIVLLAGAAFAVGARRQSRALALVAASGGDARQVRRIVLAGGGVLGLTASVIGVALGILAAAATLPLIERLNGSELGSFDVRPFDLLAIVVVGFVTGILAAVVPARIAARQDVVAVLAGRRGSMRTPRKVPVIGVIVSAVGVCLAVAGSALALQATTGQNDSGGGGDLAATLILVGAALTQIGLIIASPAIIGLAARLGGFLPLAPRLALRDAGRHRGRSAPAVAAVMAAVAGSMALSLYVVAIDDHDRRTYTYTALPGQATVSLVAYGQGKGNEPTLIDPALIRPAVEEALPVRNSMVVTTVGPALCTLASCTLVEVARPGVSPCPLEELRRTSPNGVTDEQVASYRGDPRCAEYFGNHSFSGPGIPVGGPALLRAITGKSSPEAEAVLAAGGMVVFDPALVANGKGLLKVASVETKGAPREVEVPAVYLPVSIATATAVISPQAIRSLGPEVKSAPTQLLFTLDRLPTHQEEDRARASIDATGADAYLQVERGYVSDYGPGLLALLIGSAVITLGAAGIATGLAQADARPDHATLAAVGAPPAVRRVLSMCQAAVIAGLGTLLGIAAGFVPIAAYLGAVPDMHLIIPWQSLAVTLLAIPLIAALCAGLFTRSRLPLERRVA